MRIGIDIRCLAEGRHTGVEEYTQKTLAWLFEKNPTDTFVLFFNAWKGKSPDLSWALRYPNVSMRQFRFPNKLLNLCLWYFWYPKLDRLIGGVDVFFVPNLNFVAVSRQARLVVTAHDISFDYFPQAFSWKQRLWHYLIHFRGLLRRADHIIAVSESTKEDLVRSYALLPEKITVVHSGVDAEFRPLSRNNLELLEVQKKYQLPHKFILSLGTFEPRKNTVAVVQAFEAFCLLEPRLSEGVFLVLAGAYGWKSQELKEAVTTSKVRNRIRVIGYVAAEDKPALYTLAHIFVYPSFYEGFGFPPLEALASGTPVITSAVASLPEVVGEAAILVDPYRPDDLVAALQALYSNSTLREEMIAKGKEQAKKFQWFDTAQKTRSVFKEVVV
jgi:glycosyltransferase involved in cell wall biosynthesis